MHTAHLVLVLDITGPRPVVSSAGIFSMPAGCITMDHAIAAAVDVASHDAKDYDTAARELLDRVKTNPAYAWCRPILHERVRP